jgi:hypothetical protein
MEVEKYVARDTGKLVLSSTFFLVPCVFTVPKGMHFYTAMLILTWGISVNYWRKATYGWRRDLDLVFSKISFVVFFSRGCAVVYMSPYDTIYEKVYICTGFTFLGLIVYFYHCSVAAYNAGSPLWIYYHMLFHLFIVLEFLNIL